MPSYSMHGEHPRESIKFIIDHSCSSPIRMARAPTVSPMEATVVANFADQALCYNSLKEHQIEVVLAVAGGRYVFAVLPTGYGKSL